MKFCDVLNKYLNLIGCSSKDLANAAGLSESIVSRYKNGTRVPNSTNLKKISKAFEMLSDNKYKMNDIYRKRMTLKITNTTHVYEVLHAMSDYYNKKGRKVNVICDFNPYTTI